MVDINVTIGKKVINVTIQRAEGIAASRATNLSYTASPTQGQVNSDTGTDAIIPLADNTNAGLLSPSQKVKLDNTSGTNTGDQDLSGLATQGSLNAHTTDTNNPHSVTKSQIGLGNVDNTSDLNKPISTVTQAALNLKANLANPVFVGTTKLQVSGGTGQTLNIQEWLNSTGTVLSSVSAAGVIRAPQFSTTKQTLTPTGTTQTIDWNNGSIVDLSLTSATGNVTLTLSNPQNDTSYLIEVTNTATPRNLIFPAGTLQAGGGSNTYTGTANQRDIIAVLWDGTQYLISVSKNYS